MRIGIDATFIRPSQVGGTESYLRNLLKGLESVDSENEYYIFVNKINQKTFDFKKPNFKTLLCDVSGSNRLSRILYTNFKMPKLIKQNNIDIMFFPSYMRPLSRIKNVITVSNIHDIQFKHFPEYFSLSKKIVFNMFYPASIYKSDALIRISNFVKNDIIEYYKNVDKTKLKVIYNPLITKSYNSVSSEYLCKLGIDEKNYILSVATFFPHKNLETLIKSFSILKKENHTLKLVLAGIKQKSANALSELITNLNLENDVIIPGFVELETLEALYKFTSVYVCTSMYEGFGMPPVEAMCRNIPVISTKCTSLYEVTMGLAEYYENPKDENELAKKIKQVIESKTTKDLLLIGDKISQTYDMNSISMQYVDFFNSLIKGRIKY